MWQEWIGYLLGNASGTPGGAWVPIPLPVRLLAAAALVVWGARTDRAWTVPVAATIALPVLWFAGFAILAALVRLPAVPPRGVAPTGRDATPEPRRSAMDGLPTPAQG
jgi:hypothetical protein